MSAEEAALELELFKREFLIFRDANTDKINVIYKREDGNYGLIEP
jgi:putative sigma-54 modulation protein